MKRGAIFATFAFKNIVSEFALVFCNKLPRFGLKI